MPSRLSGTDPSRTSSDFDFETPDVATPTGPNGAAPPPKADAHRDQSTVERDLRPDVPSQPFANPEDPSADESDGPRLTAGQLAATGGRLQVDRYGEAMKTIDEALSYGALDWKITDHDMASVHGALAGLSPDELRRALGTLSENGRFERFSGRMDDAQRAAFVNLCEKQGLFEREPPKQARFGAGDPPAAPSLLKNDAQLPDKVRVFIHQENARDYQAYRAAHDQYLERYQVQLGSTRGALGLKLIGDPLDPERFYEPGVHPDTTKLDRAFDADWSQLDDHPLPNMNDALIARSERAAALAGRMAPMSVAATGELEIKPKLNELSEMILEAPKLTVKGRVGPDGEVTGKVTVKDPKIKKPGLVKAMEGELEAELKSKALKQSLKLQKKEDGSFVAKAKIGGVVAQAGVGTHGDVSAAVGRSFEIAGFGTVDAKVGVEVQLADPKLNATAIRMPGMKDETFPELFEGKRWHTLSPERQRELTLRGFQEQTWNDIIRNRPERKDDR